MKKTLNESLYCYVEETNAKFAKTRGRKLFGSQSAYVNALIARDRGAKPKLGTWQTRADRMRSASNKN